MSGYTSMGSADNIWAAAGRDLLVWRAPQNALDNHDEEDEKVNAPKVFKSSFAKELEVKTTTQSYIEDRFNDKSELGRCLSCNTSDLGSEKRSLADKEEQTLVLSQAMEEFLRVKTENERLKNKMKTYNQRDERYKKLEQEVEHLTWQLSKMEQSRLVYEDATHQLGSFLELVSSQLTGLNHRSDQPTDKTRNSTSGHRDISSQVQHARCMKNASGKRSSLSVTPLESKTQAGPVTHLTTGYAKSSHKGNNKSVARKRGDQKNEEREHDQRTRTRSIDLDLADDKESNEKDKKWSSESSLYRNGQEELFRRKTKLGRMVGKMKTCLSKDKRTGKFSVNKSTKEEEHKFTENQSTTIMGFHGIWSLRNY